MVVNRHEFSSLTGRHAAREDVVKDIVTMKQNNINATEPVIIQMILWFMICVMNTDFI